MNNSALAKYFSHEVYPGEHIYSEEELLEVARNRSTTTYHVMGTCRMAPLERDSTAVVDEKLRVYGLSNLRVIDASVMPMIPSANINAAVLAIAEKGAHMILSDS